LLLTELPASSLSMQVFEVMSRGQQPYNEFASLPEVMEQVKAGYTMECPEGCREEVHVLIMKPCWNSDAKLRPGFSKLATTLVDLGAVPGEDEVDDDDAADEVRDRGASTFGSKDDTGIKQTVATWKKDMKDRPFLGPSVHHIETILTPQVIAAVQPPWVSSHNQEPCEPPEAATIFHAVEAVVKPAGIKQKCPRDGEMGVAYVDTLKKQNDVGRATALLSYTWGYRIKSIANALSRWTEEAERDPRRTYIWVCSLCLNQHRISLQLTPEHLANEFGPRVQAIGRVSACLDVPVDLCSRVFVHMCMPMT
jgi:hypothetical protein